MAFCTYMQPTVDEEHAAADEQCGLSPTGHLQVVGLRENTGKTSPSQATVPPKTGNYTYHKARNFDGFNLLIGT